MYVMQEGAGHENIYLDESLLTFKIVDKIYA